MLVYCETKLVRYLYFSYVVNMYDYSNIKILQKDTIV